MNKEIEDTELDLYIQELNEDIRNLKDGKMTEELLFKLNYGLRFATQRLSPDYDK